MNTSKWSFFSKGLATAHKEKSSMFIECIPYEYMTNIDGDVKDGYDGSKNVLKAKWINLGSSGSRTTPPDIRKGEKVHIFRYGDLEHGYYWTTEGCTDFMLRKTEHIVHEWSGNPDSGETTLKKRYRLTLSTRDGYFEFQSSKANKEKKMFNIKVDFKNGVMDFGFENDIGIKLDSNDRVITMYGAGVRIPDGWLYVDKVATVKGNIIGKSECIITDDITGKANCKITREVSSASVKTGPVQAAAIACTAITASGTMTGGGSMKLTGSMECGAAGIKTAGNIHCTSLTAAGMVLGSVVSNASGPLTM